MAQSYDKSYFYFLYMEKIVHLNILRHSLNFIITFQYLLDCSDFPHSNHQHVPSFNYMRLSYDSVFVLISFFLINTFHIFILLTWSMT